MGQVDSLIVSQFNGVDVRSQAHLRTDRAKLDTPRELINFHVDSNGHLFLPRSDAVEIHDFGANGPIVRMTWCVFGMIIQTVTGVYLLEYGTVGGDDAHFPDDPILLQTLDTQQVPIWVNTIGQVVYFGYATRGAIAGAGATYKVEEDGLGGYTVTDISTSDPLSGKVSMSVMFKGRRFIAGIGDTIYYSDLNAVETFGVDSYFEIGGDDGATSFEEYIGSIQGMIAWEDVLVFVMRSSVWLLTGSSPDTWNLRQVQTTMGSSGPWTLVRVEPGVLRYYQLRGDAGIFLFSGSTSQKVSDPVDSYFQGYSPNLVPKGNPYSWQACTWTSRYYLAISQDFVNDPQILVFDFGNRQWTVFDGFIEGAIASDQNGLLFSVGNVVYNARDEDLLPRAPGRPGKFTLGYFDQDNPYGWFRVLGVKVALKAEATGLGTATLAMTATSSEGHQVVESGHAIADNVYDTVVIPVGLRGQSIELDFTITADDDVSVLVESVELIISRKGEKVSRE